MRKDDLNDYLPSILNPRCVRKQHDISLTQNSIVSRCSLSLKRTNGFTTPKPLYKVSPENKENSANLQNLIKQPQKPTKNVAKNKAKKQDTEDNDTSSVGFSVIEDLLTNKVSSPRLSVCDVEFSKNDIVDNKSDRWYISHSSATELEDDTNSVSTIIYNVQKTVLAVSFGVNDCETVDVDAKYCAIKKFSVTHKDKNTNIDCEVLESSQISTETEVDENMNETSLTPTPLKRPATAVRLEIKKQKLSENDGTENSKVLILKTNAIEKISHAIVQPSNYKFVKRNISSINSKKSDYNGRKSVVRLKNKTIDSFFLPTNVTIDVSKQIDAIKDGAGEMSKHLGVTDAVKCDRLRSSMVNRREANNSPKSVRLPLKRDVTLPRRQEIKCCNSDAPSTPRVQNESASCNSPRKNVESLHFTLPAKSKSNRTALSPRNIPQYKIVAGTHFAVDAFSYGDIPNVKHYFLTHFHSDHYSGLKKSFNKLLFCTKISAEFCISKLGVNPKCIHIINADDTIKIDGVEVTAVDANHCPGAIMLIFTLPSGKTLLHTGDFRSCPAMESYPIFWNKDIHTIYLDTTYCNPRYDFPTQDHSLEMALYVLRQKKMALEKVGKKFSSVLIVCGTYTIGKEKFFLGMARRVGCSVWACPEKERVLQTVEGKSISHEPPQSCQLHVVPMRDLTHEKLRSYLDSMQGAFSEVVAFKPSGWENGKNFSTQKDNVTIHGIPYSEHSSFSELIRFVKFLKPKQVVPTVDISGGVKAVQKYFPCPLLYKDEPQCQTKLTDYFSIHSRQQVPAVT